VEPPACNHQEGDLLAEKIKSSDVIEKEGGKLNA